MTDWAKGFLPKCNWDDSFKDLTYCPRIFGDPETIKEWEKTGHNIQNAMGDQYTDASGHLAWADEICDSFELDQASYQILKIRPGTVIPLHQDPYSSYMKIKNIEDVDQICRASIFLEDWKSGHYLEVDGQPIINYKKGEYVIWKSQTPHLVANVGNQDRYTLIITGIKNENTQFQ